MCIGFSLAGVVTFILTHLQSVFNYFNEKMNFSGESKRTSKVILVESKSKTLSDEERIIEKCKQMILAHQNKLESKWKEAEDRNRYWKIMDKCFNGHTNSFTIMKYCIHV